MKDRIIDTVGKTWKALGQKGEATIPELSKILKEKEEIVAQAIGWLAREDKVNYTNKNNKTFVSLVESEMGAFQRILQELPAQEATMKAAKTTKTAVTSSARWIL